MKSSTKTPMLIAVVIAALVLFGVLATTRNLHRGNQAVAYIPMM